MAQQATHVATDRTGLGDHAGDGHLVFLNFLQGSVQSCTTDGKDLRTIVSGLGKAKPDGVQVDLREGRRHIYWTDMGEDPKAPDGYIQRCDLDGGNLKTILPIGNTRRPKQLQLDKANDRLYWCDREGMRVMRCNLDGSHPETLVTTGKTDEDRKDGKNRCVGIVLDHGRGLLYWTQKGNFKGWAGRSFRANVDIPSGQTAEDRTDIETLFTGLPEPIDLEIDEKNQLLYWTDRGDPPYGNSLNRAKVDTNLDPSSKPRGPSKDLVIASKFHETIGLALDLEGGRIFLSDLLGGLYSVNLDGSNKKTIFEDAGDLTGVTYVKA